MMYKLTGTLTVPVLSVLRDSVLKNLNTDAFDSNVRRWKNSKTLKVAAVLGEITVAGYHRTLSS